MSSQRSRKVRMGSSRRHLARNALLADDVVPETQTDPDSTDSVNLDYSEHGNRLDLKEPISEILHETSEDIANASEKCGSLIRPPSALEIGVRSNRSPGVSQQPPEPQKEDMPGNNRTENLGMSESNELIEEQCREFSENKAVSQMGMLPDDSCQKTTPQRSTPANDNRTPEVSQCSGDDWHPRHNSSLYSSPAQPFADDMSNCPKQLSDSIIHKGEHEIDFRKENTNSLAVSFSPGTKAETREYLFQIEGICGDVQSSVKKEHEVKDYVNPLLTQFEHPIQSVVCPLLIEVPNQEEAEQEQITNTTPESHDTTGNYGVVVESQHLTIQDTFNPGNNQEMTVQDDLENTKRDHIFDLSDLEHNMKENTCSQVCESEGQASNKPWEFIEDSAQEEGEGHSLNIGPLQSECSSASADDENDHTRLTRGGNISFNDGTVENLTKQPVTDAEFMEPEKNQSASEKTVNLDSTIEFKDGCNNDCNITTSTEFNPQSEDVVPTSSNVTLSDSHSVDVLLVESCPSTNMADVNPLATVPQHCTSSGEDQCKSKEMYAPTSSQLRDGSAQVGAQTSTGLSHSLGITEIDLNKSYLENKNKNPVEMPEVETDFPQNSEGAATDCSRLDKDVKLTELASNQEQDGDLDIKSSRKKRKNGSSRRIGNKGIRGGVDHSGEIVESDFSTDPNKTNKSFEAELKVEMKCNSELPEGGMLGTFTDKADCLFLIPPQSEEIKERGSEDIIDKARKEEYTGANIHLPPEGSHGDVDDRKEDEAEEKSEIVEKMEVIKMPLFKTMSERNIQEISEEMSRQHHEEEVCRASTGPQEKDIRPPGAVFDLSDLEHNMKENTCSQVCESEGQASNEPWEFIKDSAQEEGEGHSLNIGPLQSECSSASADDEKDHTCLTRGGNISFNDGTVENLTKQPVTDAEFMEPEKNQSASEKTVNLDSTIEFKDGCNNDSNITPSTEMNPQSEDVVPTSSNVTLSDSHSVDVLLVESCPSTNMADVNPLATVPQHCTSSGEDQCKSKEMYAPTSSQLRDGSAQVGAQTSTGLSHSLGITEIDLNKSYLENENKNPVEMPEVETDFPQNSEGAATDCSRLDKDVKLTELASNQEQDGDLDIKSSRKKRKNGSSRRIGNKGIRGGVDHSGEIVESDFSTDPNKTNKSFEAELKVEMKCNSELPEGGMLGTFTDKADCLFLIPPQSEEIKERGSEDIIDKARKEEYTGANIHLPPEGSHGDVDDRKEDEAEEKSEIVEKMEVIKMPLFKTMSERNIQEISEEMSRQHHEEEVCRASTGPQEKDIRPPGAVFDLSDLEHNMKENTCSQVCESEGQASNEPWEFIKDSAQEEGEGHSLNIGPLQSECSSASADDEKDHTCLTRGGNISFNDGTVENLTKQPVTDAEFMEPEKNQSASEKTVNLDSTIEFKDGCNNDSNITPSTEMNPQSEDVVPTSSNVTLSDSHSVDVLLVESCPSTNMADVNPLATVPQHCTSSGEDQCKSKEMYAPTSSQLRDGSAQVGAQTSTGLSHSLGITEIDLNKSYLENENKNPVEMPEVETDFPQNSEGAATDCSRLDKDVKLTELASNQEQDGDLDIKSSRKKRKNGSSRRIGNKGIRGGVDHSGEIVESDFSTDPNKTNKSFEAELKVEMKCNSELPEGGMLGTFTDKADCLFLIPPQSEEIKERGSEDIIDKARKEEYTGANIHLPPEGSHGDVDDRKEDEAEEKSEIVEKMEVIKMPLFKTMSERNIQEISEEMSRQHHEEEVCRASTGPQEKDIRPPGAVFDLSDLEHNMKENTCSQVCESEGQASNEPWEFIKDSAQEEGEGHSLNIGPLQSECSSASADDEKDHTCLTRGGNISFNDGTVENLTKQPVTDAEFMEPEKNQSASEKTVNLDSTIEFKDGCNNDSNITPSTEMNPQSEDVVPTSSNVTLSDSHSVDVLLVESCPSTNMADVNPLATVPQHCTSSGEDQCKSKEMYAPTSSQLRDGSAQVGAQTSTGLSHSLGITEIDLNKSYLENENKNPVEMPEVETDFPQNSEGAATDCSRLDKDVKLTELASNQEQDGDLDIKSSRKKRKNGSSRRIGNKGIRGGVDHSGEIVESDFSTDPNKTNKSFEAELKVEMKCNSELPEGGMLGTFTDKADCLFLIPPQSEEIKERGSEDIIDKARKEEYTGANIHLPPEGSHGDVDDRKEDEAEEKSEIVEKMEVIKMPLFKTMSERNIQEISEEMSRQHHEEEVCRASTGPQEKDIRPPGAVFDLSDLEHNMKENTCSQVCESEGQASNEPWEFIKDSAQEEGEGHSLNIGPLQSECSSASADDEKDHTCLTRGGNISFNDGTVENLTKQPVTDAEFMEPEKNQSASEKTVNLDSTIEFKDGCNNDSNITPSTEMNPQSEDVVPTSSNVTLSDSHSIDVLLVESCLSTNMADVNPLLTVPQHCPSSGEDQCISKEMYAPTSSQLRDGSAQVGAQTSTGLSHSLGITEIDLNKSYLENENKNPVEMPEVEKDFPQNSEGAATDCSRLDKDVKLTELASNQEQDGELDIKSSRKKRKIGSSRRIGNKGIRGGVDHSGEIVESDFSTDPNKTNKSFEAELKVEMKCNSELPEGGMLGTFTDKADCLFLIPPQSEEIKERGSEDIIDKARKEEYTGANIHLPPEGSHGDVDDRKEDEAEEKSEIVEKMEVIKMPLFKTMSERNIQEISEEMSRQHHEEEVCRASTGPQEKDIRPPGAVFDLSDLEHNMKENTCSQVCESEGQASNEPWEFIKDSAQEEGEGHSLNIGPLQSECSSASADDEKDHTCLTRGGNISFNDGTVENLTKQPVTDAEFMEPEKNQSASEKTVNLDSTIEFKDGCNNDSNITPSTEMNPQSEDVVPTSSNVTLSDSHSIDVLLVESCLSTNMADVNPLLTVPQHCPSSGEDQCISKEMYAPTSSQLRDGSAQVGAQTSTGLSHSLGITEIDLNKSYLENENKNPVEMPEVEKDFPQNREGAATDCSRLDKDVKLTELASNQEQVGDLDIKSSRKKRKIGSSRRIGNKGIRGGVDHSGEIVESDFSTDPNKTNKSFEAELKVEMKCNSELPEGGMLGTFTDKADCLFLIPPQSEEIKERGSEDIIDKARKEEYTGANIHLPPEGSHGDVDDRKEEEAEEKSEIVEKMEVTKMPLFKTMSERNIQEISEEMSRQHHEEEVCRASTGPQEKDIRPPGADFPMLAQSSLSKENTPHSEDMNSSILFAPVSGIRDTDGKMDTAGQHPTAHSSNLDQISGQGNQHSLPNVKDDDKQVLRRRKMGSSRWTKGTATGSQKGSKEAQTTADQEIEKHAVISENISEEDLPKQIFKDNEGAEKVVTEDKEPSPIGGDAHQSMSETNISATQTIVRRMLASSNMTVRMTPIQENIQEKKKVDSESSVSEDRKMFKDELKMKVNKDNETEQNGERSSETDVKRVNTTLSGLPSELSNDLHVEGRRRKLGSQRKSRGQQHHDYPPESEDQRALNFGDHPPTPPSLSRQITGNATRTFDPSSKCDLRADCFNVVMVGSSNVGKTSFMKRVQSGSFSPHFSASIGIDTCIHALPVDGSEVRLQLWDTAGQERFRSISKQVFHKGQAFLLMYDITSSKSFSDVRYWIGCIQESAGKDVIILLLGNKSDCAGRQVNPSEGQRLAKEYNIDFNECSAATGEHIISSIESLARKLTENDHTIEEGLVLQKQTKNRRCC